MTIHGETGPLYIHCPSCRIAGRAELLAVRSKGLKVEVVCEEHADPVVLSTFETFTPMRAVRCNCPHHAKE